MKTTLAIVLLGSFIAATRIQSSAAPEDDPWQNLSHVTRSQTYWLVDRDGVCALGKIGSVTPQSLTLKRPQGRSLTVERQNVLRLGGLGSAMRAIYSGRSSWDDVKSLMYHPGKTADTVRVINIDGKQYEGKLGEATDTTITLSVKGQPVEIPKANVCRLYHIRFKPMTDRTQYVYEEGYVFQIFDPALWPYFLGTAPKMAVRLYDSSLPEENSILTCKNNRLIQ